MVTTARTHNPQRPLRRTRHSDDGGDSPFIWREALWGLDWLSLRLSPVYLGIGVPHGDGSPVILVPGFLTTDAYMVEMYFWLRRVGSSPFLSGIGVNADCIQTLTQRLEKTAEAAHAETGKPVRIIGHSLGGLLARRLSLRRPDIVSQLISLGAPVQALEAHPTIMAAARVAGERAPLPHTLRPPRRRQPPRRRRDRLAELPGAGAFAQSRGRRHPHRPRLQRAGLPHRRRAAGPGRRREGAPGRLAGLPQRCRARPPLPAGFCPTA